jgi:hypothetical protein
MSIYIYALLAVAARQADEKAMAVTMTRARNIGTLPPVPFLTSAMATKRWMYLDGSSCDTLVYIEIEVQYTRQARNQSRASWTK